MTDKIPEPSTEPAKIIYYCKDCKKIVSGLSKKGRKKYSFKCPECAGSDVSYGTEKSIVNYYHIRPADLKAWGLAESAEKK